MDLSNEMNNYLQELGFDPNKEYDAPSSLEEASIRSIEAFIGSALPDKPKQSGGYVSYNWSISSRKHCSRKVCGYFSYFISKRYRFDWCFFEGE